ncbi:sugar MFS transporter [Compostibacter hankyongensis]|uniref:Sugar MFS transporter n=1 Tax=Compostibacter hankyongensis TaxID=1007089 RepID=A0ABP8FJ43_9BACT
MSVSDSPRSAGRAQVANYTTPMIIIGMLFAVFGFVTWVNGTLIPYLQIACELTTAQALWVTFAFYISYALMAFPSSWVLKFTGFKKGMMLGLLIMSLGTLIFIPAANTRNFAFFLTGLFVTGIGLAVLQTASNPYVTILGPIESAARRMSIMGICNKGAGALAPLIMGAIMLNNVDAFEAGLEHLDAAQRAVQLDALAARVIVPYIVITVVLILLAVAIRFSALPDINKEEETNAEVKTQATDRKNLFKYPYLIIGFITLFLYVGVEVIAGDIIQIYGKAIGIPLDVAKHFTTYTLIAMLVGYLLGIALIPKVLSQEKSLYIGSILGLVFSLGAIFTQGYLSIAFVALLGFANAPMWPAIWPLALDGVGRFIKMASALLIIGIAGGAIIPRIWGVIGEHVGYREAFWLLVPCYLVILFYAAAGHKIGKTVHH